MNKVGDQLVTRIRHSRYVGVFIRFVGVTTVLLAYTFFGNGVPFWALLLMIPLGAHIPARIAHEFSVKKIVDECVALQRQDSPLDESNALVLIGMSNDPTGMDPRYRDFVFEVIERSDFDGLARHQKVMIRFVKHWLLFRVSEEQSDIRMNGFVFSLVNEPGALPEDLRNKAYGKLIKIGSIYVR